jgi:hypothetical protein
MPSHVLMPWLRKNQVQFTDSLRIFLLMWIPLMSFIICTHSQISLDKSRQGGLGGRDVWHAWERRGKCTGFCWESQRDRDRLEDQEVNGRVESEWILGRLAGGVCVDWIRLAQDRYRWLAVVNAVMNRRVLAPWS